MIQKPHVIGRISLYDAEAPLPNINGCLHIGILHMVTVLYNTVVIIALKLCLENFCLFNIYKAQSKLFERCWFGVVTKCTCLLMNALKRVSRLIYQNQTESILC